MGLGLRLGLARRHGLRSLRLQPTPLAPRRRLGRGVLLFGFQLHLPQLPLVLRVRLLELRLRRERDRLEIGPLPLLLRLHLATAPPRLLLKG